ncbi:hypothetical protein Bca52824_083001 [Brassica carinata]|uniref:Dolichyl-diphosphooligosaccharide--protein glycosyltransferase subunit 1 n=1 Tax=Brassica carinata TaxID=52824 RepID=A0A8X7PKJ8_BRACI|nr:hypothetical protein Bca52824_083001 [Brassica carinata]
MRTPDSISFYTVALPKPLNKGETLTLEAHVLQFPEKITQKDIHLVMLQESAQYLSPYAVESQSLSIKLPNARVESDTKLEGTKVQGSEIKYGPYKNLAQYSYAPTVVHFESKADQILTLRYIAGRPVVVLEKNNVVPDHNQNIQVYYKFSNINLLSEPLMLTSGFFVLFITCIIYTRADFSISKSSAAYLAKLQWDEVLATLQEVQSIIQKCLAAHDKLEASLRDLSRTGDIQTCKASRKPTDSLLKDLSKELRPLLLFLQSSPSASQISPKVLNFSTPSTHLLGYEKKSSGRDIKNRIVYQQQKIIALRQEVEDILDFIDVI